MAQVGDTFYRYEDRRYAPMLDEFDNPSGPGCLAVELKTYLVTKTTPCGVWLQDRFVNQQRVKQFAHASKTEALAAFFARKARQIRILRKQLADAQKAVVLANSLREKCDHAFGLDQAAGKEPLSFIQTADLLDRAADAISKNKG